MRFGPNGSEPNLLKRKITINDTVQRKETQHILKLKQAAYIDAGILRAQILHGIQEILSSQISDAPGLGGSVYPSLPIVGLAYRLNALSEYALTS